MNKNQVKDKMKLRQRTLIIFGVLSLFFFGLIGRLCYLTINDSTKFKAMAVNQRTNEISIEAKRGKILDRNGIELAISADVYRIDLDLNTIRKDITHNELLTNEEITVKLGVIAKKLADATGMKYEDVNKIVNQTLKNGLAPGSATLIRQIEKVNADKVAALKINGVMISSDTKRYYPNDNFLAHVLGFTVDEDIPGKKGLKGMYGVEAIYNDILKGTPGRRIVEMDRKSKDELPFVNSTYSKPVDGKDVVLTIDRTVQHSAELAAEQALKDYKAKAVSIVVSDPTNGEIIAMVNKPDYNPNNPRQEGKTSDELNQMWRNRSVMDTFEVGSILKVITAAAAMEEGLVNENDYFNCNSEIMVDGNPIGCDEAHGSQNFPDIIKNSCNVGFVQLGERLGKEKLNRYIKLFGFGQKTGIDLNGEAIGIVKKTEALSKLDLANLAFGQLDSVSCIQYIAAFNAVANGGNWIRPHVMKEVQHVDENNKKIIDEKYNNLGTKKILDPAKMQLLRGYLEKVVTEGTATSTFIEGYHIAGKTGTAQKAINGGYGTGKYVSSFAGMAPSDNPKYTVMVSVDEPDPSNYFAHGTAVPVAKQMFLELFSNLSLSPNGACEAVRKDVVIPELRGLNKAEAMKKLKNSHIIFDIDTNGEYISNMDPLPGIKVKEGDKITLTTGATVVSSKSVIMPELKGYSKERVVEILDSLGLKGNYQGDGSILQQDMTAGQQINKGITVNFVLKKSVD